MLTTNRSLSEIIREAVSKFVNKNNFFISTTASYLPKGTKNGYKYVSAYFARSDWNLLHRVSKNTGRSKTELVREAVDEYVAK